MGSCFLLIRFAIRWSSLHAMRRKALLIGEGPIRIFHVEHPIAPFSFGNAIYVNPDQHSQTEWEEIILHEYVHIRQRHTLDILFGELLIIVNWYNPFAWLIRHSIRQNLEFIADRAVIDNGHDKKGYQYHLLKVVGQTRYKLANNFNFSSLKKRIVMMNKLRSARLHLIRFLFILPLLAVLLVAFRDRLPTLQSGKHLFVNAAGIVIGLPDRMPMPGVTVIEKTTGVKTVTDTRGYYKLSIPVKGDGAQVRIEYSRTGFEGSSFQRSWPLLKQNTGLCDVGLMSLPSAPAKAVFMDIPNSLKDLPADPGYKDAMYNLKLVLQENDELNTFAATQKAHAEIALWYITEDKQKRILIHTDGTVERYGYPGTPSLARMDAEYGGLPAFMTRNDHPVSSGYLSRWAAISAQAQKDFHTTNRTAKAIIFPGDSRVIAVPVSGKAKVYDMDNDAPEERPAFEQLYGKLPDCVPTPRADHSLPVIQGATDTIPRRHDTTTGSVDYSRVLWIVDGVPKAPEWNGKDSIKAEDIASMDIYKAEEATRFFGEQGAHGVIAITTKKNRIAMAKLSTISDGAPLMVVDGSPKENGIGDLNPDSIESITVLKSTSATAIFGKKGANGVVLIKTKKDTHMHLVGKTKDAGGNPPIIVADTTTKPQDKPFPQN